MSVSELGDGMSVVTVAWLSIQIAPAGRSGLMLGAALAAYSLPGAAGALLFGRWMRRLFAQRVLMANSCLRAILLGCVPVAWATGTLHPILYIALLAGSSLLQAWGGAGQYTLLAEMLPADQRLAANALVSSSASASVIIGPALAGLLVLTWLFYFLYGPVEVALPLHVTKDLHAGASLLGLYWALFGVGAVAGSLAAGALRKLPLCRRRWASSRAGAPCSFRSDSRYPHRSPSPASPWAA